jgi:hypothetical protein
MKPRNREVNIFNMSVLDLLTGALGAFCFLTLALFPSYYKTHKTSPGTSSNTDHAQPAKPGPQPRSLEGPVPPFGFLNIQAVAKDRPGLCASLEVTGASSASGGDLSSFPADPNPVSPGSYGSFFLFAFRPGEYHLTVRATHILKPCEVDLVLQNPNNKSTWPPEPITDAQHSIEFDFNILSTDLNSDLWNNG